MDGARLNSREALLKLSSSDIDRLSLPIEQRNALRNGIETVRAEGGGTQQEVDYIVLKTDEEYCGDAGIISSAQSAGMEENQTNSLKTATDAVTDSGKSAIGLLLPVRLAVLVHYCMCVLTLYLKSQTIHHTEIRTFLTTRIIYRLNEHTVIMV